MNSTTAVGLGVLYIVAAATLAVGYVLNIVSLITTAETTGWIIARTAGIVIPFVGGVLGWF